jgi:hypothetical protein
LFTVLGVVVVVVVVVVSFVVDVVENYHIS